MEPEYSGSSSQRPRGIAPARPLDTWEQFYAGGSWAYCRDAGRGASWVLARPTLVVLIVSTSLMIGVFAARFFCAVSRLGWRPRHHSFRTNNTAELIQCAPG